jgi:hypothetical protein
MSTRLAQLTATALAALVVALVPAASAKGGGPTSVLLSVPGADSTTSLYYLDSEYDLLSSYVGINETDGTFTPAEGPGEPRAPGINVTWLIHDVSPWRLDRIVLAEDGPWISTTQMNGNGRIGTTPSVWHRPANPVALVTLLQKLGLDLDAAAEPGFEGVSGQPVPASAEEQPTTAGQPSVESPEPAVTVATDPEGASAPGWAWAVAGLVVGLLAGAMVAVSITRRRWLPLQTGEPAGDEVEAQQAGEPAGELLVR